MSRRIALVGIVALALILSLSSDLTQDSTPPDITVAPCALWSTDVAPVLPPYTRTDVCITDNGQLSYAQK